MRMAQDLAGYSLGQADLLRRAMGKKKTSEMQKQREDFINGATKKWYKSSLLRTFRANGTLLSTVLINLIQQHVTTSSRIFKDRLSS